MNTQQFLWENWKKYISKLEHLSDYIQNDFELGLSDGTFDVKLLKNMQIEFNENYNLYIEALKNTQGSIDTFFNNIISELEQGKPYPY